MKIPEVSIIIGAYNCAQFIQDTIQSVQRQTWTDWELIIIDDASTDDTYKKIIEMNDDRIIVVQRQCNSGRPAVPRNIGVQMARGNYVAFLDHDDLWAPSKLAVQLNAFAQDDGLGLVYCSHVLVLEAGVTKKRQFKEVRTFYDLLCFNAITCSSVMVKKAVLNGEDLFDEDPFMKIMEDTDLWARLMYKGVRVKALIEPLVTYRVHEGSNLRASYYEGITKGFYMCSKLFLKLGISKKDQIIVWWMLFLKALKKKLLGYKR